MAKRRDHHLPRLSIAGNISMQQPNQPLYSPALPTSIQQGFHPPYPMTATLQTPMQPFFQPQQPPQAPGRPNYHQKQASVQLATAGFRPPSTLITPVASHFPRPSLSLGPNGQPQLPSHPFPQRNRRQLSIGGPPKAVLGGPTRKVSPLPLGAPGAVSPVPPPKAKKHIVNLPKETIPADGDQPETRQEWARNPLPHSPTEHQVQLPGPEVTSAEPFPPDHLRHELPAIMEVYLPDKLQWDVLRNKEIEAKLEKLGVEPASGHNPSQFPDPHHRKPSVSSPADPALLMFKLNKLQNQQAREASPVSSSLAVSPQPPFAGPFGLSPSPNHAANFGSNRHVNAMSFSQPFSYQSSLFSASPNPFGQSDVVSEYSADGDRSESGINNNTIHAPQGRVPVVPPPLSAVGGASHVDFIRGFGIDIPEESEEELLEDENAQHADESEQGDDSDEDDEDEDNNRTKDMDLDEEEFKGEIASDVDDGTTTVPHSRVHSRHVSKLSAVLSSRMNTSLQPRAEEPSDDDKENEPPVVLTTARDDNQNGQEQRPDSPEPDVPTADVEDAVAEWTGSEDVYPSDDDESLGEFSNPSDEDRARRDRAERRTRRRIGPSQATGVDLDQPRRLPNFPQPPESTLNAVGANPDDDIISNPSEEENLMYARRAEFMGVATEQYYPEHHAYPTLAHTQHLQHVHPHHYPLAMPLSMPMALPHSRIGSGQFSIHDPAAAHSRTGSGGFSPSASSYHHSQLQQQQHQSQSSLTLSGRRDSLNPFAKPFVLGPRPDSAQNFSGNSTPSLPSASVMSIGQLTQREGGKNGHSRVPSLGKPLNVSAPEFKPGSFSFKLPPGAPKMPSLDPEAAVGTEEEDDDEGLGRTMVKRPGAPVPPSFGGTDSVESSPFKTQGREKRQRRGSTVEVDVDGQQHHHQHHDEVTEGDSFHSFRFPMKPRPILDDKEEDNADSSPRMASVALRRSASFVRSPNEGSGLGSASLNPSATPFTFAGFNAIASNMPSVRPQADEDEEEGQEEGVSVSEQGEEEEDAVVPEEDESNADASGATARGESNKVDEESHSAHSAPASPNRPKRAPIPLDFKPGNTVPAGLFKALANNEDRASRRAAQSRLSSREIFDQHLHRPSMDDMAIEPIAQSSARKRLGGGSGSAAASPVVDDVFGAVVHARRRSSLPDTFDDRSEISRESSVAPQDLTTRFEAQRIEGIIADLLDEKLAPIRLELAKKQNGQGTGGQKLAPETEAMMADVISLFREQLQESARRSLEDSQADARGELDLQMVKEIVEQGNQELLARFQHDLQRIVQQLPTPMPRSPRPPAPALDLVPVVQDVGQRTVDAVIDAVAQFASRTDNAMAQVTVRERAALVEELVSVIRPIIIGSRPDPIDYEFLTRELAQAVKPHISQLIDLASDKRETATLIVDRILPLLPSLANVSIDTDGISRKLVAEVRKAIEPIDAHEIKEQVSELVVERLDSRLALRDKQFNVDTVANKVKENVSPLFKPLDEIPAALDKLSTTQADVANKQADLAASQSQILASIASIPDQLDSRLEDVKSTQDSILKKLHEQPATPEPTPDEDVLLIKDTVEVLSTGQLKLIDLTCDMLDQSKANWPKLDDLPHAIAGMLNNLQDTLGELITSRDNTRRELDEQRKLNTELQVQVTKARGSHGQVRVEKDVLSEKLSIVEGDRDRLRDQVKELQTAASQKAIEMRGLEARSAELEESLTKAQARLQALEGSSQTQERTIAGLESSNKDLAAERQRLLSKVDTLESEYAVAHREREASAKALETLQKQCGQLSSQQSNQLDVLTAASDKINMVFNLLERADNEEVQELKQYRDRSKALESDNAVLLKRIKEMETKLANAERTSTATRQSLTQTQQRSAEWERRAKEYEGKLELVETKLEQAEQTQSQLDADYSLVKLQLEEREADARLAQDHENRQRDQITALEAKCTLLQKELEKARSTRVPTTASRHASYMNGNTHPPPRPDSRASTIDGRIDRDSHRLSPYSTTQRSAASTTTQRDQSVWDSMHAPTNVNGRYSASNGSPSIRAPVGRMASSGYPPSTPKPIHRSSLGYSSHYRAPSPTPSAVSAVPTQGDDGWYE